MIKDKSTYLGVLFLFLSTLPVSCTEDEHHELLKIENVEDLAETNNHSTDYSNRKNIYCYIFKNQRRTKSRYKATSYYIEAAFRLRSLCAE